MITSLQNQRIKDVVKLSNARERHRQDIFLIEGVRELSLAASIGNFSISELFICDELINSEGKKLVELLSVPTETVSAEVYRKMAYREDSDGIIATARQKHLSLRDVKLSPNPFVIVVEAVEKPGNLGAILRTADAARVDAVVVCDPKTDIYNPNIIRSSIGCVFAKQVVACSSEEALQWLKQAGIRIFAADPAALELYHETDLTQPSAIVMGTEANGLTDFWLRNADRRIKIPMRGYIDSLNVSVSTAVITFEAMRQRVFVKKS